jgi:hypothetical protein
VTGVASWASRFKAALVDAELMSFAYDVRGSRIFLPYGWQLRTNLLDLARAGLAARGYLELHLPNLVSTAALDRLDRVHPLSGRYLRIGPDLAVAASHEAAFFTFLDGQFRRTGPAEVRYLHVGPVFRRPKTAPSGFVLGERTSFLEAYAVLRGCVALDVECAAVIAWTRELIAETLRLPSVHVERPRFGNHPVSTRTVTHETLLPSGRTSCTAMVYRQDTIFTREFLAAAATADLRSVHAAVTDNLILAYLAVVHDPAAGFRLHSSVAPHQVVLVGPDPSGALPAALGRAGWRVHVDRQPGRVAFRRAAWHRSRGVPVTVVDDRGGHQDNLVVRAGPDGRWVPLDGDIVARVVALIRDHDRAVDARLRRLSAEVAVDATDLTEVNDLIAAGRIARFYAPDDDATVQRITAELRGGEVLGFDCVDPRPGRAVTGAAEGRLCYAARRT